jgi:hypothetical protein
MLRISQKQEVIFCLDATVNVSSSGIYDEYQDKRDDVKSISRMNTAYLDSSASLSLSNSSTTSFIVLLL